jgi:hypothetical protein
MPVDKPRECPGASLRDWYVRERVMWDQRGLFDSDRWPATTECSRAASPTKSARRTASRWHKALLQ